MKSKRILIVEDEATGAFLMKEALAELGDDFEIGVVGSGEEALREAEQRRWDLIVTDHRMPGMTGLELIRSLRARAPDTLTILVTAYGSEEIQQAAEQLRVFRYMTKPFPLNALKQVVQDALALKQNGGAPPPADSEPPAALKVTLGGEGNVGKTTLIRRLCTGEFEAARVMTIGVDFHLYDIERDNRVTRLIVWDVSGQEQFAFTRRAFYRGSKAVGLVYDVSRRDTFDRLPDWRDEIRGILPSVPLVVVGNKIDLERQVSAEEGAALASRWGVPFFETSCLTGTGVCEVFAALADAAARYGRSKNSSPTFAPKSIDGK